MFVDCNAKYCALREVGEMISGENPAEARLHFSTIIILLISSMFRQRLCTSATGILFNPGTPEYKNSNKKHFFVTYLLQYTSKIKKNK